MVEKYTQFARNERNITLGASQQFTPLVFTAEDDTVIVGVMVEIALGLEMPTDPGSVSLGGYARLAVYPQGAAIPLVVPNGTWNTTGTAQVDTLLDEDSEDTWAITPFAMAATFAAGVALAAGGPAGPVHLKLAPATKRRLRRGDQLVVEMNYSNGGDQNSAHQEVVTGTLFTQG